MVNSIFTQEELDAIRAEDAGDSRVILEDDIVALRYSHHMRIRRNLYTVRHRESGIVVAEELPEYMCRIKMGVFQQRHMKELSDMNRWYVKKVRKESLEEMAARTNRYMTREDAEALEHERRENAFRWRNWGKAIYDWSVDGEVKLRGVTLEEIIKVAGVTRQCARNWIMRGHRKYTFEKVGTIQ